MGVRRQQGFYLQLYLLNVYLFTANFEILKFKIYFNFELNSSLFSALFRKILFSPLENKIHIFDHAAVQYPLSINLLQCIRKFDQYWATFDLVNDLSVALVVLITGPRNMFHVCYVFIQDRGCNSFENDI